MLVPRRYVRQGGVLLATAFLGLLLTANRAVVPWGKPSWAALLGEAGPAVDRDFGRQHAMPTNLTLHIIAHSHSDIGWNYSFGEYYKRRVRQVLRNVAAALWMDRTRTFTWGDVAYLDMWLDDEGDRRNDVLPGAAGAMTWRAVLGELIGRRQWEIVGATYVSPDEGLTTWWAHNAIVDVGRRFVARHLNTTTRVAWQIDPFGHAHVTPHLLANAGFTSLMLGRMDYRQRLGFEAHGDYEFLWQAPYSQAPPMLTHYLSGGYAPPSPRFDFDSTETCDAPALLAELVRFARSQAHKYPGHGHVLVMMGDDFRYANASKAFACLDRLVGAAQAPSAHAWRDMTLQYSSPARYLEAIRPHMEQIDARVVRGPHAAAEHARTQLRLHRGDFYPYQDKPYEQYWSGMFTTRPALKRLVRSAEQAVQHVEALVAIAHVRRSSAPTDNGAAWAVLERALEFCRKQVAIGYHHDAVTGTCAQSAADDYEQRLRAARRVAMLVGRHALQLAQHNATDPDPDHMDRGLDAAKTNADPAPHGYNTADGDDGNALLLAVPDAAQPRVVVVTNANHMAAQTLAVRLHVPSLDVALVDAATGRAVDAVAVQPAVAAEHGAGFQVDFVARAVPPLGWRSYVLANATLAARTYAAPLLGEAYHGQAAESAPAAAEAVLEKDGVHVRLAIDRRGSAVRISTGHGRRRRVVVHQLRQYPINPRVQASGAYVMHSFMLMYAIVFYVFGGGLCAGLAASVVVALRRTETPRRRSPLLAVSLGAAAGLALTYYIEQVASIAALDRLAGGSAAAAAILAAFAFGAGYCVAAAALGANARLCVLFVYGVAAAVVAVLFGVPTWQSRPLAREGGRAMAGFRVSAGGPVCDTASVAVADNASVMYRLCTGRAHVIEVAAHVRPAVDREVVAHFALDGDGGGGYAGAMRPCAFDMFDGVGAARRWYSRWTPVPGNYYPAVSHVALASGDLALHSRQATGATCIAAGTLEVGMHRSMSGNDFRGLDVPLIDSSIATVTHFVDTLADRAAHSDLLTNVALNAPALAFLMPIDNASSPLLEQHSGLGLAADADASAEGDAASAVHGGCVRFVGIHSEHLPESDAVDVYARVQVLPGNVRCLDKHGAGVIELPRLLAVGRHQRVDVYAAEPGDWSIGEWQRLRREQKVDRISLRPGQQALFRFEIRKK